MKKLLAVFLLLMSTMNIIAFGKDGSLEKIKKQGNFIVGLDDTFAPMGFKNEKGEIVGFDIDLAREVAKRMGVEVKFKTSDWDGIIFELRSKKIDVIWNGLTITEERKKQMAFTEPYFSDNQIVITKKDSSIEKISELAGKKVGVQLGSSSYYALERSQIYSKLEETRKYSSNVEVLLDIEAGRIQAGVMDSITGRYYIVGKNYKVLEEPISKDSIAIGLRKEDKELTEEINKQIIEMKKDGTYNKIYEKWFGKGDKNVK
ncbi:MAG: amino acid ABC transporter substrate-binding protein [Fusobacteriaceae bacterium]